MYSMILIVGKHSFKKKDQQINEIMNKDVRKQFSAYF